MLYMFPFFETFLVYCRSEQEMCQHLEKKSAHEIVALTKMAYNQCYQSYQIKSGTCLVQKNIENISWSFQIRCWNPANLMEREKCHDIAKL